MFVCRPSADRPDEFVSFDIHEASNFHPSFEKRSGAGLHINGSRCLKEFMVELEARVLWS